MKPLIKAYKGELSPYKAINEYISDIEKYSYETTKLLLHGMSNVLGLKLKKAHPSGPLIFKGRIQYNPKTGKPIAMKEWRKLEAAIIKFLGIEKDQLQKKMVHNSFWLGALINRLNKMQREKYSIRKLPVEKPDFGEVKFRDYEKDFIAATEQSTGIYLQNVTDKARSTIQQIIVEGAKQRKSSNEVFQDLWDQEEDINRDWDRVVRTEIATNANNGFLMTTLSTSEEEHIFLKGVSGPNACAFCKRLVKDQLVVLVNQPPTSGEKITIDGKEYIAIWPGKSNFGRSAKNYWTAPIIHPHCRCSWTEWDPELENYAERLKVEEKLISGIRVKSKNGNLWVVEPMRNIRVGDKFKHKGVVYEIRSFADVEGGMEIEVRTVF